MALCVEESDCKSVVDEGLQHGQLLFKLRFFERKQLVHKDMQLPTRQNLIGLSDLLLEGVWVWLEGGVVVEIAVINSSF